MSTGQNITLVERFPLATPPSTPLVFYPPAATTASRKPALRSRGSSRGMLKGPDNRIRVYESYLEARFQRYFMTSPDVAGVEEQVGVFWTDRRGKKRVHTFDLIVTLVSGERIAVAIKPAKVAGKNDWKGQLQRIWDGMDPSFADDVALMTDEMLDRITDFNCETMFSALHDSETEWDAEIGRFVGEMDEPMSIGAICEASGFGGDAFWSIVRLIAARDLRLIRHVRITSKALVARHDWTGTLQ